MTFSKLTILTLLASFLTGMMVFRPVPQVQEDSKLEQSDPSPAYLADTPPPATSSPSPSSAVSSSPSTPAPTSYDTKLPALSKTAVYNKVNPAVVTVLADREIGSGSIIQPGGLVLTNNHVVRVGRRNRQERQIRVRLADGREYPGRTVARDRPNDLALIQLDSKDPLPTVPFASGTTTVQSGEVVYAIGSPFGRPGIMTEGTLTRILANGDLQTTVLLKAGNSGGPLLNRQGEMIGVNKGILELRKGVHAGISFATSLETVQIFLEQYRSGTASK